MSHPLFLPLGPPASELNSCDLTHNPQALHSVETKIKDHIVCIRFICGGATFDWCRAAELAGTAASDASQSNLVTASSSSPQTKQSS